MGRNKTISFCFCVLAFIVVFAHSLVPHEHHCNGTVENHIHHFQHCEGLNTYILKSQADLQPHTLTAVTIPVIMASVPARELSEASGQRLFDFGDHFIRKSSIYVQHGTLRGPPEV